MTLGDLLGAIEEDDQIIEVYVSIGGEDDPNTSRRITSTVIAFAFYFSDEFKDCDVQRVSINKDILEVWVKE